MTEEALFAAALEKATPAERAALLDEACAGDSALRRRVEALLESHEHTDFLKTPAIQHAAEALGAKWVAHTIEAGPAGDDESEFALNFLAPSEKPGSLGRLGHYEILEVIGRGGMGIVLRGFDEKLHRVVAIKVMAAPLATSAAARRRFTREAQAAAAVSHDHIVTIHAVEEADGLPYLVMQYVAGMSLQERLDSDRPLQLAEILRIGMQTASGLAAAHAQGLIHRDIKPANILLENGVERVKLTDFGLARAADDASPTQSGVVAGTPQYMAPEQARGESVDQRADLFSLGSVLYAMCTGRAPFRASGTLAVMNRVCKEMPSPIREANPEIPDWLIAIVEKLHAKNPAERYQTAAAVAEVLGQHLAHVQHPSVIPLPRAEKPTDSLSSRRRRHWVAAAAVLLCLLAGVGLAEATGVTQFTATVIRILTPDGTLIVEAVDPGVNVTIEGNGGLVITGAGPQEVRLRPGSYQVHATKDGKPVRVDRDLVTITRNDKQVVRVHFEGDAATAAVNVERGAFVLIAAGRERKFDTLAEVVLTATDGDIIEVRGNGPFVTPPLIMGKIGLTIRAGSRYRPILQCLYSDPKPWPGYHFFHTQGPLVLEGLEFHWVLPDLNQQPRALISSGPSLHVANCTFRLPLYSFWNWDEGRTQECVVRNCAFYNPSQGYSSTTLSGSPAAGFRGVIDNSLICGYITDFHFRAALPETSLRVSRTTHIGPVVARFHVEAWPSASSNPSARWCRLDVSSSILGGLITSIYQDKLAVGDGNPLVGAQLEERMRCLVAWRGEQNVYTAISDQDKKEKFQFFNDALGVEYWRDGPSDLDAWRKFWASPETGSIVESVRFQGGNLISRLNAAPEKLTPDDFRLRPDSAGYRAGRDGRDLGADVDLVGPGPAYERWKKTTEYEKWLMETRLSK